MKIAMWSGPRNLSTAMMYSFAQRADFSVLDEPFYAAFLAETGIDHPMRAETLKTQPTDPNDVITKITGPTDSAHQYQKHMTHHMLPGWNMDWLANFTNVFLIRHPARVIASYAVKRLGFTADDLGFQRQYQIFQQIRAMGQTPAVIDSSDIRADPKQALTRLCLSIGLSFDPAMLHWPKGGNPADGVWGAHWYGALHDSTGFAGAEGPMPAVESDHSALFSATMPYYEAMQPHMVT